LALALYTPRGDVMWIDERGSEVLEQAVCWQLLAIAAKQLQHGRIGVPTDEAPLILPVNFTVHEHDIVVRLGAGHMASAVPDKLVAFEVDSLDANLDEAWSVLVRGLATVIDGDALRRLGPRLPQPWVPSPGDIYIRIRGDVVTGRRFVPRQRGD
jgi:hypothetical protein